MAVSAGISGRRSGGVRSLRSAGSATAGLRLSDAYDEYELARRVHEPRSVHGRDQLVVLRDFERAQPARCPSASVQHEARAVFWLSPHVNVDPARRRLGEPCYRKRASSRPSGLAVRGASRRRAKGFPPPPRFGGEGPCPRAYRPGPAALAVGAGVAAGPRLPEPASVTVRLHVSPGRDRVDIVLLIRAAPREARCTARWKAERGGHDEFAGHRRAAPVATFREGSRCLRSGSVHGPRKRNLRPPATSTMQRGGAIVIERCPPVYPRKRSP
jgi:hypothetical protein